jgi:hypothetical protein
VGQPISLGFQTDPECTIVGDRALKTKKKDFWTERKNNKRR